MRTRSGSLASDLEAANRELESMIDHIAATPAADIPAAITASRRGADLHYALGIELLVASGGLEATTGMLTESSLQLDARLTRTEAYSLARTAAAIGCMPKLRGLLRRGLVSGAQVRAIAAIVRHVDVITKQNVDEIVAHHAPRLVTADPDHLIGLVQDAVDRMRAQQAQAREQRRIDRGFLVLQPKLGGGGSLYGEADEVTFATLAEAIDHAAGAPSPDATRPQQRMAGLARVAEAWLSRDGGGGATRARLYATVDLQDLAHGSATAELLTSVAGGRVKLTPLTTETVACDAEIAAVIFKGMRPVAVGDWTATVTDAQRKALVARDRGCRFPGCGAPAAWTDAHHIRWRTDGGATALENLVLLCRKHHRIVHRRGWTITLHDDGTVEWSRRGRRYISPPPMRE